MFFWDGLKTDVQKFMTKCFVFQQNKVETIKTPCLLQLLSILSQRWKRSRWILSQVYQSLKERVSSWWLLIDLLNMHTFVHYLTSSKNHGHQFFYGDSPKTTWYSKYYSNWWGSNFHWKFLDQIIFLFGYSTSS